MILLTHYDSQHKHNCPGADDEEIRLYVEERDRNAANDPAAVAAAEAANTAAARDDSDSSAAPDMRDDADDLGRVRYGDMFCFLRVCVCLLLLSTVCNCAVPGAFGQLA